MRFGMTLTFKILEASRMSNVRPDEFFNNSINRLVNSFKLDSFLALVKTQGIIPHNKNEKEIEGQLPRQSLV